MCLTRWFQNSLSELNVMKLSGHSDFETTHRFYLSVIRDLLEKALIATAAAMSNDFGEYLARVPFLPKEGLTTVEESCYIEST
jgi:hypothetical protein